MLECIYSSHYVRNICVQCGHHSYLSSYPPPPTSSPPHPTPTPHLASTPIPNPKCRVYALVNRMAIGPGNGLSLVSAPSHYLNQCRNIMISSLRNKLQEKKTKLIYFHSRKCNWKCRFWNGAAIFFQGGGGGWVKAWAHGTHGKASDFPCDYTTICSLLSQRNCNSILVVVTIKVNVMKE